MNGNIQITELDFDSIKNNFKNYMKSQTTFQDYNFDASSLSIFLDILAYNTFYNAFYINSLANEMFLDSATLRESVVSRAKSLGYSPSSRTSSYAYCDLEAHVNKVQGETPPNSNNFISLEPYAKFTTNIGDEDYTFITNETKTLYYDSEETEYWVYKKNNVKILEGELFTYSWKVQEEYDKYVIPNKDIDVSSLIVQVYDTEDSLTYTTYTKAENLIDINANSNIYWINEGEDKKFYIEFGNNEFGSKLNIGNIIEIKYILCSGEKANGSKSFSVGNYEYANNLITEADALNVTMSNYVTLGLSDLSSTEFNDDAVIRGETSNTTGYVYDFDINNSLLKLYSVNDDFQFGETIHEETTVGGNTVFGANGVISSIKSETSISTGGSNIEDINSIKYYAPKFHASQNRLVTSIDYETLIKAEYPYIESIVCWGGEEETPQQLGNVFISCKPKSREYLDQWEKDFIANTIIEPKKIIGLTINFTDPDFIYIRPTIEIKYNADLSPSITKEEIENDTLENIRKYCKQNCNKFNSSFYYSSFVSNIDDSNEFILGNETNIQMIKNFTPDLGVQYTANNSVELNFSNDIKDNDCITILTSSEFSCNVGGTTYTGCEFQANGSYLMVSNSSAIIDNDVGEIDYNDGIIIIDDLIVTDTVNYDSANNNIIEISVTPDTLDLVSSKNQILKIDSTINLTATPIRER